MSRYGFAAIVVACITGCGFAYATRPDEGPSPLENVASKHRILVICTGDDTGPQGIPMYNTQFEEAKTDWAGYYERDLIVVWLRDRVLYN
ncbi:MAG: hypothetical protein AAGJ85_07570 [Pseudomonadota bacterium]